MAGKRKRRGSKNEKVRKITRTGAYTFYVTIPKTMMEELGWRERQLVEVRRSGKKIIIEDWKGR